LDLYCTCESQVNSKSGLFWEVCGIGFPELSWSDEQQTVTDHVLIIMLYYHPLGTTLFFCISQEEKATVHQHPPVHHAGWLDGWMDEWCVNQNHFFIVSVYGNLSRW
jgi:hypothetical protein